MVRLWPDQPDRFLRPCTKWIEVVGFMKEQVTEYVDTYFEKHFETPIMDGSYNKYFLYLSLSVQSSKHAMEK